MQKVAKKIREKLNYSLAINGNLIIKVQLIIRVIKLINILIKLIKIILINLVTLKFLII